MAATAAPSHLFRSRGGPRESLDTIHEFGLARDASVVVAHFFNFCVASRSRRFLSHARSPPPPLCVFRCSLRAIILMHRNATPLFVGTARLVAFPEHLAYRRQTPSGPENAR